MSRITERLKLLTAQREKLVPVLLFLFALVYFSISKSFFELMNYQARDMHRAFDWLSGAGAWFGPELSGGGHTPGPFFYWLLAIPLGLFGTWQSVVGLAVLLVSVAATLAWFVGKKYFSPLTGVFYYFIFLQSSFLVDMLTTFWNPSFLFAFQMLTLALLMQVENLSTRKLWLAGLLLGFTVQIHLTQFIFLGAGIFTLMTTSSTSRRLQKILILLGGTLLPLLPYFSWRAFSQHTTMNSAEAGLHTLLGPFYFFSQRPLSESLARIVSNLHDLYFDYFEGQQLFILPIVALILYGAHAVYIKKRKILPQQKVIFGSIVLSLPFVFSVLYDHSFSRYLMAFALCCYLLAAVLLDEIAKRHEKILNFGVGALAAVFLWRGLGAAFQAGFPWAQSLAAIVLGAALIWLLTEEKKHRTLVLALFVLLLGIFETQFALGHRPPVKGRFVKNLEDRQELANSIWTATGWSYSVLRTKTYFVATDPEDDFSIFYEQASRTIENLKPAENFDGLIVAPTMLFESPKSGFDIQDLARQNWIRDPLKSAAEHGELKCLGTQTIGPYFVCYYTLPQAQKSALWNNLGSPFLPYVAGPNVTAARGVRHSTEGQWIFHVNSCTNLETDCTVYFEVRKTTDGGLTIEVTGRPVSVPHPGSNPAWVTGFENLSLEITCPRAKTKYYLAEYVGWPPWYTDYPRPFLLAPFKTSLKPGCTDPTALFLQSTGGASVAHYESQPALPLEILWQKN